MALVPGEACAAAGSARSTRKPAVNMAAAAHRSNLRQSLVLFICILPVFVICKGARDVRPADALTLGFSSCAGRRLLLFTIQSRSSALSDTASSGARDGTSHVRS